MHNIKAQIKHVRCGEEGQGNRRKLSKKERTENFQFGMRRKNIISSCACTYIIYFIIPGTVRFKFTEDFYETNT